MNQLLVKAIWDDDAEVWVATSDDLPGLVVEGASTDELEAELKIVIPELLKLNGLPWGDSIPVSLHQESSFFAATA